MELSKNQTLNVKNLKSYMSLNNLMVSWHLLLIIWNIMGYGQLQIVILSALKLSVVMIVYVILRLKHVTIHARRLKEQSEELALLGDIFQKRLMRNQHWHCRIYSRDIEEVIGKESGLDCSKYRGSNEKIRTLIIQLKLQLSDRRFDLALSFVLFLKFHAQVEIDNQNKKIEILTLSVFSQYISNLTECHNIILLTSSVEHQTQKKVMIKKQLLSSQKQDDFANEIYPRRIQNQYDYKRIKRIKIEKSKFQTDPNSLEKQYDQIKMPVKIQNFREDIRQHHRQQTQQTHEFMKIVQNIIHSSHDQERFTLSTKDKNRKKKNLNDLNQKNKEFQAKPIVNLKLETEFSSSVLAEKFQIEPIYNLIPFKKSSIEIQPIIYSDPKFQFYVMKTDKKKSRDLADSMINISEDNLPSEFKSEIKQVVYYLDFFDYINFVQDTTLYNNDTRGSIGLPNSKYPYVIEEICNNTHEIGYTSDQEAYNRQQITIGQLQNFHRIFECSQDELAYPCDSIHFSNVEKFQEFKREKTNEFKSLKIYDKDKVINTDVHRIIFSEKIYLINIQEEIRLMIQLAHTNQQKYLMRKIHGDMLKKIDQYLRLICGYSNSTITTRFNIFEPYKKIYQFLSKSIIYNKPYTYEQIPTEVTVKFPVLEIWYQLPEKLYGYSRQTIQNTLYELIKVALDYEKKIKHSEIYEDLKIKKEPRKYQSQNEQQILNKMAKKKIAKK